MDPRPYFLASDGRLRAGWRLLVFVLILAALEFAVSGAVVQVMRGRSGAGMFLAASAFNFAVVLVGTWVAMRVMEHKPLREVGLACRAASARSAAEGLLFGAGLAGTVCVVEWLIGAIAFETSASRPELIQTVAGAAILLALAAAFEELLFRGYAFQTVISGIGALPATAAFSGAFGLLHLLNPNATALSTINTVLAGVLLSLCYLRARNLWYPIGWHFAWNAALAFAGLPVSGLHLVNMPWQAVAASGSIWLFGGDYGPEGGVVGTAALLAGTIWIWRAWRKRARAEPLPAAAEQDTRS